MSVDEFVYGSHARLDKTSTLKIKDDSKGYLLLRHARLDDHDKNIVNGFASGDYSLLALLTSLQNAYRLEGLPSSSLPSSTAGHHQKSSRSPHQFNHGP